MGRAGARRQIWKFCAHRRHDEWVTYWEWRTDVVGMVLWGRVVASGAERSRILPDGCLDVIWDGDRLFVAGPDSTARWHHSCAGTRFTAVRFHGGIGPAVVGVPADKLVDQAPDLEDLLPWRSARLLAERVAAAPADALQQWVAKRLSSESVDPLGPQLLTMATAGMSVTAMAEQTGINVRQVHRRCLVNFGYGPRRLVRVLRMQRALNAARAGVPLADVAASCGYADQAHLCRETRDLADASPRELIVG
jgi:AraC-like DNA-binding protein